ncbi:uncharacterized protein LOC111036479 [Myzus persicae]|uniref:uncharacterized protein LOC111036479 n=1 Tax=Myzus persicae TaxID=13164 RepID=UPI000B9396DA|nr:uncharacterized protein LOC111036479 [Myzus persicae]
MLKLFFVIITLTTLVKSEDAAEWICEEINQMGNCSSLPKIPPLIRMMEIKSNTNEYPDAFYCPYSIVNMNTKCIHTYFLSCYDHMTEEEKTFFSENLPMFDDLSFCIPNRPYKKEFKEHSACLRELAISNDQLDEPQKEWQLNLERQKLMYELQKFEEMENDQITDIVDLHFWRLHDQKKCQYFKDFMRLRYIQMRSRCGMKTEKFFRQLLGNIWPMSALANNCEVDLLSYHEG